MLKQARAYGVGQILVTQNPVDLDYKGLSNAGTWFIGKLQTEKDKDRLLDGLQGASHGSMDRQTYDEMISKLGKREFLLHNVHTSQAQTFRTRWVMNYLAGPLTRAQIPALNQLVGAEPKSLEMAGGAEPETALDELQPVRRQGRAGRPRPGRPLPRRRMNPGSSRWVQKRVPLCQPG